MDHVILRERLASLERQLALVASTPQLITTSAFTPAHAAEQLHATLDGTIGQSARRRRRKIEQIEAELDRAEHEADASVAASLVKGAWRNYLKLHEESQEVFSECLEFVGGLAIRTEGYDDAICQTADELIRSCATESTGNAWNSFTVPAAPDALAKTLARMVRLRFPDWTIWTLPSTAHEYGHVVIDEVEAINEFVLDCAARGAATRLGEVLGRLDRVDFSRSIDAAERERVERELMDVAHEALRDWRVGRRDPAEESGYGQQLSEFLRELGAEPVAVGIRAATLALADAELRRATLLSADVFATYTMGPAYSCAALLLNFLPSHVVHSASDAERAHVVLETLARMNASGHDAYGDVIGQVSQGWSRVMSGPGSAVPLEPAALKDLDDLVERLWVLFHEELRETAPFEAADERNGWLAAKRVSLEWRKALKADSAGALPTQEIRLTRLRDALNAAWYCRLLSFRDGEAAGDGTAFRASVESVERATEQVCTGIIASRERQRARRARSGRRSTSRSPRVA